MVRRSRRASGRRTRRHSRHSMKSRRVRRMRHTRGRGRRGGEGPSRHPEPAYGNAMCTKELLAWEKLNGKYDWGNYECRLGPDGQYGWIDKRQPGNYNPTDYGIYH